MPEKKLFELCRQISKKPDARKLAALIDDLVKLLNDEQDVIKARIRANLSRDATGSF